MDGSKLEPITDQAQLRVGDLLECRNCVRCRYGTTHRFLLLRRVGSWGWVDVWKTTGIHHEQCWPCAIREGRLFRVVPPEVQEVTHRRLAQPLPVE